jgi:hypothetical protein
VSTPTTAYEWAQGKAIPGGGGGPELKIRTPLDFYAVADHAEFMGVFRQMANPQSPLSKLDIAKRVTSPDPNTAMQAFAEILRDMSAGKVDPALTDPEISRTVWQEIVKTVDAAKATYDNSIGSAELAAAWTDPDFDPAVRAFHYARVIEIPTPRWSTRDAARLGIAIPGGLPASIQERAWTSPIWYSPRGRG